MRSLNRSTLIAMAAIAALAASAVAEEIAIPAPIAKEHAELHERVHAATEAGGATGEAAKALAEVLAPHFEKEERYALPQLGALSRLSGRPLAAGELTAEQKRELMERDALLRAELPRMLREHEDIGQALERFRSAAEREGKTQHAALAEAIELHASTEETVLYPAALLVGRMLTDEAAAR